MIKKYFYKIRLDLCICICIKKHSLRQSLRIIWSIFKEFYGVYFHTFLYLYYIRKIPNLVSGIGAFKLADKLKPSTTRVSTGSITPSSHNLKNIRIFITQN